MASLHRPRDAPKNYETLTHECQQELEKLKILHKRVEAERADCVANLDAALYILATVSEHYVKCEPAQRHAILFQMVEWMIITAEGQVQQIEWKSPFCYLHLLKDEQKGGTQPSKSTRKTKTDGIKSVGQAGSLSITHSAPTGIPTRTLPQLFRSGFSRS